MKWNAELYQDKHDFVAEYGKGLLEYVANDKAQVILDLGCGTGDLTYELTQKADEVIGVDGSEAMIQKARGMYPQIEFQVMDACILKWQDYFNVIFSNAVFHWIPNQIVLLEGIYRALRIDGKLICEFGANGNIANIQRIFQNVIKDYGYDYINPFYFPTTDEYKQLVEQVGFNIELIIDYDRPTALKDNKFGLRNWLKQFFANDLLNFTTDQQENIFEAVEDALRSDLWDGKQWIADYRRIRVIASK